MQKCFLVTNKVTQIRDYLEHRSIVEVVEERRALAELDLAHLGIVDVDKLLYIYYASDDGDLAFRTDLNMLRQLLSSPFFNASEGIFILVDTENPMIEDLIRSACRDTELTGPRLTTIHHKGALTLSDVSVYVAGTALGTQTSSSYRAVYVREEDSEEHARFADVADGLESILPVLTDQYAMYKKRAEVEAMSSSRNVSETFLRPQVMRNFAVRPTPIIRQWRAFVISGTQYTKFENAAHYLSEYFTRVGNRCMIINMTTSASTRINIEGARMLNITELANRDSMVEKVAILNCKYTQLGFVAEMLDNLIGVNYYIFVCDPEDYSEVSAFLAPLCEQLYCSYVLHFTEDAVQDYLATGAAATTVFLSRAVLFKPFEVTKYRSEFEGTRVAEFFLNDVDTTDFYECATGGGLSE